MARLCFVFICTALVASMGKTESAARDLKSSLTERFPAEGHFIIGSRRCTWGPGYWCKSHANAKECNALKWCVEKNMLTLEDDTELQVNKVLLGEKPCSRGPGYWCKSHANAKECNALKWCVERNMLTLEDDTELQVNKVLLGEKPCSRGPGYWCKSHANAKECNALNWCVEMNMLEDL